MLRDFSPGNGRTAKLWSLPALEAAGHGGISRLPVCLRVVLESLLRHCDGVRVREDDVLALCAWRADGTRTAEIPFIVGRILLQDFTGVPVLVDLAAMRSAAARLGKPAGIIEPLVPVELVVDHSVQVDYAGTPDALVRNVEREFARNEARYRFLKWGTQAFAGFRVVPPEVGIVHQVNLESLARGVMEEGDVYFPDSLVGTDSHTTMINGLGIVGWGVGGIEAEAGMLGEPISFLTPDVVGVNLTGALPAGTTATDLVLSVTEALRKRKVVGKFVEFYGDGAARLAVTDRATIANMAPEYGATMGFFPVDEASCRYLAETGRPADRVETFRRYYEAQEMFGMPRPGEVDYSEVLEIALGDVVPAVSGPRRPQDRIALGDVKRRFDELMHLSRKEGGYGKTGAERHRAAKARMGYRDGEVSVPLSGGGALDPATMPKAKAPLTSERDTNPQTEIEMMQNRPTQDPLGDDPSAFPSGEVTVRHGDVVIAAITSCTNTSNPSVMLGAGLVARNAVRRGLSVQPTVKASLAPGSRVVTEYLRRTGLQESLDALGFHVVGYGCTTCIGNSGPLEPHLERAITAGDLVAASVLSGNRNFEARIHQSVKANFLMSPPLVVAFALRGSVDADLTREPVGHDPQGKPVFLKELWPAPEEIEALLSAARDPQTYRRLYGETRAASPRWRALDAPTGKLYAWEPDSTYVLEPPYFDDFGPTPRPLEPLRGARALARFGDSLTTDHISPAGAIKADSPAGRYLVGRGVPVEEFNTYGARRGSHEVMVRGTFANVRLRNLLAPDREGGWTVHQPSGETMTIYEASLRYAAEKVPLVIFAGTEYGTGSSRDWAAKGTRLLGVRAVIAKSFERIHRSNLVGMGVLPLQAESDVGVRGDETFELEGLDPLAPRKQVTLRVRRPSGDERVIPLCLRIDTPIEAEYYRHGGILPYVLRARLGKG